DRLSVLPQAPARTRLRATVAGEDEIVALGERVSIVPGLRWELFADDFPGVAGLPGQRLPAGSDTNDYLLPRLGVRVEPVPGYALLGNAGRYVRVPNLQELFGRAGVVVPNPTLRPEVAINWDLGFRLTPASPLRWVSRPSLEYAYFDNRVDDLIV